MSVRRGTANMLVTLPTDKVRPRLHDLAARCHVLALQEWGRNRNALLSDLGSLHRGPWVRKPRQRGAWTFARPRIGGRPLGVRTNQGEQMLVCRAKVLTGPGRVDVVEGRRTLLGPSLATKVKSRREDGTTVVRYNVHFTANVQHGRQGYRDDRPLRVARHRKERATLERLIAGDLKRGHDVEVYGDVNFHQMPIKGLRGWWTIAPGQGTLGNRAIDGIWTSRVPSDVEFLEPLVKHEHRHVVTTGP